MITDSLCPVDAEEVRTKASSVLRLLNEREARLWAKTIAAKRVFWSRLPWLLRSKRKIRMSDDEVKRFIMFEEGRFPHGFFWYSKEADRCERLVKATGVITRRQLLLTVEDVIAINLKPQDPE